MGEGPKLKNVRIRQKDGVLRIHGDERSATKASPSVGSRDGLLQIVGCLQKEFH
jgi:hypothetical protein